MPETTLTIHKQIHYVAPDGSNVTVLSELVPNSHLAVVTVLNNGEPIVNLNLMDTIHKLVEAQDWLLSELEAHKDEGWSVETRETIKIKLKTANPTPPPPGVDIKA